MPGQSAVTVAHLLVTEVTSRFSVSLKFTLTKDVTSNQCCSRKFVGNFVENNLVHHSVLFNFGHIRRWDQCAVFIFYTAFAWHLWEKVSKVHQLARDTIASRRQKRLYDQGSRANSYRDREKVWLLNRQSKKGRNSKLQTPWESPWEVTKHATDVVYWIKRTPKGKPKFVHTDRLKPFYERHMSSS